MATQRPIHMLVLNAGVSKSGIPDTGGGWYNITKDGFEEQIGTNYIAHYTLARLLEPRLRASAPARVVSVASAAERMSYKEGIRFDLWRKRADGSRPDDYDDGRGYGQSKLANIIFTREFAERNKGSGVTAYSLHPGIICTQLERFQEKRMDNQQFLLRGISRFGYTVFQAATMTVEDGALTQLYVAASPDLDTQPERNGGYFYPIATPGKPTHPATEDSGLQKLLWERTEDEVKGVLGPHAFEVAHQRA
eukprot:gnl/MRDRNA2_/MRDRNA2_261872_c0_seq1.p1 gnl/MRDRNA2_/MRDRNA2_261872_c0~~gnl/MRDRNA2_/MRDRNA2_261872_c0_seq1.p1  ORF type:complete len:276 (-),score=47.21 gnl/MRDRNA2_/MRDRNA2_261872_c0_seq1:68-817(-)